MTGILVLVGLTLVTLCIGLARDLLPGTSSRFGYVLGLVMPLLGLAYAIWQLWNRWVGWEDLALLPCSIRATASA